MKLDIKKLSTQIANTEEHAKKSWRRFLFTPAHYWKHTLLVITVILLIILLADMWVFWRLGHVPRFEAEEIDTARYVLKREEMEKALQFLREREVKLLQIDEIPPPRELFAIPPQNSPL